MKRSTLSKVFGIALLVLFATHDTRSQSLTPSSPAGSKQDQVIQELLAEVRQLRIALQQISVNAYRGQVLVERLRLQQEQVNRLSQELNSTRNQIGDRKSSQVTAKTKLDEAEKHYDIGMASESVLTMSKAVLDELKRDEQKLSERELQVAAQLETERASLADLNKRLDTLEVEMLVTSQRDDKQKK